MQFAPKPILLLDPTTTWKMLLTEGRLAPKELIYPSKVKTFGPGLQMSQELWDLSESVWPILAESVVTHPEIDIWAMFQHHCWIIMFFPKALSRQISIWGC